MYSVDEVIQTLNTSMNIILVPGLLGFVGAYIYYIEAIRLGFRDKTHAINIFANMYFFSHDFSFTLLFNRWFNEVNHWIYKAFWFAIILFVVLECIVHYQTIKYSRKELFPQLTQEQYIFVYLLIQVSVAVIFYFVYSLINDFLYLIHFAITLIISNIFSIQILIDRGSRQGQSLLLPLSSIIGSDIGFFGLFLPLLASYFRTLPFILLGIASTVMNLIYIWLYLKLAPRKIDVEPTTNTKLQSKIEIWAGSRE